MQRIMLKSKIHRATLTGTELHYEGSITVDQELLDRADILPGEQVHVLNVNTGDRLVTYAISAPRKSGVIMLNGPAARMGMVGDPVVILTYVSVDESQTRAWQPRVILVDKHNHPRSKK